MLQEPLDIPTVPGLVLGRIGLFIALAPSNQINFIGAACAVGASVFYAVDIVMTDMRPQTTGP